MLPGIPIKNIQIYDREGNEFSDREARWGVKCLIAISKRKEKKKKMKNHNNIHRVRGKNTHRFFG